MKNIFLSPFGFPTIEQVIGHSNWIDYKGVQGNTQIESQYLSFIYNLDKVCRNDLWYFTDSHIHNFSQSQFYYLSQDKCRGIIDLDLAFKVHLSKGLNPSRPGFNDIFVFDLFENIDAYKESIVDIELQPIWVPSWKRNIISGNLVNNSNLFELEHCAYPLTQVYVNDEITFNIETINSFENGLSTLGINDTKDISYLLKLLEIHFFDDNLFSSFPFHGSYKVNAKIIFLHIFGRFLRIDSLEIKKYLENSQYVWEDFIENDKSFFYSLIVHETLSHIDNFILINEASSSNEYAKYSNEYGLTLKMISSLQTQDVLETYNEYEAEFVDSFEAEYYEPSDTDDIKYTETKTAADRIVEYEYVNKENSSPLNISEINQLPFEQFTIKNEKPTYTSLDDQKNALDELSRLIADRVDKPIELKQKVEPEPFKLIGLDLNTTEIASKRNSTTTFTLDFIENDIDTNLLKVEKLNQETNIVTIQPKPVKKIFNMDSPLSHSSSITDEPDEDESLTALNSFKDSQNETRELVVQIAHSSFAKNEIDSLIDFTGIDEYVKRDSEFLTSVKRITVDGVLTKEEKIQAVLDLYEKVKSKHAFYPRMTDLSAWKLLSMAWLQSLIFIRSNRHINLAQVNKATYLDLMSLKNDILKSWNEFNSGYLQKRYLDEISFDVFSAIHSTWEYRQYMEDINKYIIDNSYSIKTINYLFNMYTHETLEKDKAIIPSDKINDWINTKTISVDLLLPDEKLKFEKELRTLMISLKDKLKLKHNEIYGKTDSTLDIFKISTMILDILVLNLINHTKHPIDFQEMVLRRISEFINKTLDLKLTSVDHNYTTESIYSELKPLIRKREAPKKILSF